MEGRGSRGEAAVWGGGLRERSWIDRTRHAFVLRYCRNQFTLSVVRPASGEQLAMTQGQCGIMVDAHMLIPVNEEAAGGWAEKTIPRLQNPFPGDLRLQRTWRVN